MPRLLDVFFLVLVFASVLVFGLTPSKKINIDRQHSEITQTTPGATHNYQLNNSYISLNFSTYGGSISLTSFQLNTSLGLFGSGLHEFLYTSTAIVALRSSSGIFLANETWLLPQVVDQTVISSNSDSIDFKNLQIGSPVIASEDWFVQLQGPELIWSINRTFAQSVDILADRLPGIVFDSYAGGIPSFLDEDIFINGTGGFLMFDHYAHLGNYALFFLFETY